MIVLLHGDHIEASRKELARLISENEGKEIRRLDGKTLDQTILTQALESGSLFAGDTWIVIENLFGKIGKKIKLIEQLATKIKNAADTSNIVLWEEKEIGKTVITTLGNRITIKLFKTPAVIFQFLDNIKPGNAKILITLFQQLLEHDAPELVFSMIIRRIRQLMMLRDGVTPPVLQGWQISRLTSQTKLFTMEQLRTMHARLLDIDYSVKTGNTPFTLRERIELWIMEL